MTETQYPDSYYTCMVIATLFSSSALKEDFMAAYNQGPDAAVKFLGTLGMPQAQAQHVVSLTGDDLNEFVGQNVCTFLW